MSSTMTYKLKNQAKQLIKFCLRFIKRNKGFFFFSPEKALKNAGSNISKLTSDQELEIITKYKSIGLVVKDDVIYIPLTDGKEREYSGGLIDCKTGTLIEEAIHLKGGPSQEAPQNINQEIEIEINQTVFLGGMLYDNFGHLLFESISRLWAYSYVRELDPYIFFYVPWTAPDYLEKNNYAHQIFTGFGIPHKKIIFTNKVSKFKRVIIAPQKYGNEICKFPDHYFMEFLKTFKFRKSIPKTFEKADKVYVSRVKIPYGLGKPIGEKYFEAFLESNDYRIFYPELYSVNEQLTLYANAQKIIFCDGSALHSCILLYDLKADITIVARRKNGKSIADQFVGFGKDFLWIDEVKKQYQFGLADWSAVSEINWYEVSIKLLAAGFIENVFTEFSSLNYEEIVTQEIKSYIAAIKNRPEFISFLKEAHI